MQRISAVICELNPVHSGHKYIFSKARELSDVVIAVMSGNFVQRGETAILHKYERAKAALDIGADLVCELPFPWSAASAEYFGMAGVAVAEGLLANSLVFGSECGNTLDILHAAELMQSEEFFCSNEKDKRAATQRKELLHLKAPYLPSELLSSKNDILGIEYCKNIKKMTPYAIKRISCESATDIRNDIYEGKKILAGAVDKAKLFELEYLKLRCMQAPDFKEAEATGGVGERLWRCAGETDNGTEMLTAAKTKQYTNARLRRAALFILAGVTRDELKKAPLFTTILAANSRGISYLNSIRQKKEIEALTKPSSGKKLTGEAANQFERALFADNLFTLCTEPREKANYFLRITPYIDK